MKDEIDKNGSWKEFEPDMTWWHDATGSILEVRHTVVNLHSTDLLVRQRFFNTCDEAKAFALKFTGNA